jgi:hypothetical protein
MFTPINLDDFTARTGNDCQALDAPLEGVRRIVALRDLLVVEALLAMPRLYLDNLIRNVTLVGSPEVRPYAEAVIEPLRLDPRGLSVGQTFLQRSKYQNLMEKTQNLFADFSAVNGFSKRTAAIAIGRLQGGERCLAHYVPPIVEINQHSLRPFLLDGIHRNFVVMSAGTTIESVVIRGVTTPLPCSVRSWGDVRPVDEKPPKQDRFFNLKPELFRDVKHIGIDG